MSVISLLEWQKRFGTEISCNKALVKVRWSHVFSAQHLVLKGGLSALRLSKHIGVSWPTASNMLK